MRAFKKILLVLLSLLLAAALFVYIKEWNPFHKEGMNSFTETAEGIIVDASGVEYTYLCTEGSLSLNDLPFDGMIFEGSISGEPDTLNHLGLSTPTGMYSVRGDRTFDILLRYRHDSEWYSIYCRASLEPSEVFSRLEDYPMPFSFLSPSLSSILD